MDGLTIRNGQALLEQGRTLSEIRANDFKNEVQSPSAQPSKSFADTLKEAVGTVNAMQKDADVKMQQLATGKTNNIPEVMIAVEKADISLRLMTQVRNKVIEAYQEVMKMQV